MDQRGSLPANELQMKRLGKNFFLSIVTAMLLSQRRAFVKSFKFPYSWPFRRPLQSHKASIHLFMYPSLFLSGANWSSFSSFKQPTWASIHWCSCPWIAFWLWCSPSNPWPGAPKPIANWWLPSRGSSQSWPVSHSSLPMERSRMGLPMLIVCSWTTKPYRFSLVVIGGAGSLSR